jgi:SulP family sulfate permease
MLNRKYRLIFHLGMDLLKESIIDTWSAGIHQLEYITILIIVAVMGFIGFTEGIMIGIILACVFFVVMYARKPVVRSLYTGSQLRSTVHRLYRQQKFLDQVGGQICVTKLQGFIFFGTVNQCMKILELTPFSN